MDKATHAQREGPNELSVFDSDLKEYNILARLMQTLVQNTIKYRQMTLPMDTNSPLPCATASKISRKKKTLSYSRSVRPRSKLV